VQLLSKDRRALAAARRLGLFAARKSRHKGTKHTDGNPSGAPIQRRAAQTQTTCCQADDAALTSRQRRSRARAKAYYERKRADERMDDVETTPSPTRPQPHFIAPPPAPDYEALERCMAESASLLDKLRDEAAQRWHEEEIERTATPLSPSLALTFADAVRGGSGDAQPDTGAPCRA